MASTDVGATASRVAGKSVRNTPTTSQDHNRFSLEQTWRPPRLSIGSSPSQSVSSNPNGVVTFECVKVGRRFGKAKRVLLHVSSDGTLTMENSGSGTTSVYPAGCLDSAQVEGRLRLRLVPYEDLPKQHVGVKERVFAFETKSQRSEFVTYLTECLMASAAQNYAHATGGQPGSASLPSPRRQIIASTFQTPPPAMRRVVSTAAMSTVSSAAPSSMPNSHAPKSARAAVKVTWKSRNALDAALAATSGSVHLLGRLHVRKDYKTSHFGSNWKKRYATVRGEQIWLYKRKSADGKPHRIVDFSECLQCEYVGTIETMRYGFRLHLPGRLPWVAAAASKAETDSWVATINTILEGGRMSEIQHRICLRGNVRIRKSADSTHLGFNWKSRHMVLDGDILTITKSDDPEEPIKRELQLLPDSRCGPIEATRPHAFVIINFQPIEGSTQPLLVSCDTDEDMMNWTSTVQQAIQESWDVAQDIDREATSPSSSASVGEQKDTKGPSDVGILSAAAARAMKQALADAAQGKEALESRVTELQAQLADVRHTLSREVRRQHLGLTTSNPAVGAGATPTTLTTSGSGVQAVPAPASTSLSTSSSSGLTAPASKAPSWEHGSQEAELAQLRAHVQSLQQQLRQTQRMIASDELGEADDSWDGALSSAEERLRAAATRLQNGDAAAQAEFDHWDKIIQKHPEQIAKLEAERIAWESANKELCKQALSELREIVPTDIFSVKKRTLEERGLPRILVQRLFSKKALTMVHMEPARIRKLHITDLRNRYVTQGLDIRELRAVYAILPEEFENDPHGKKREWRTQLYDKLVRMTKAEAAGRLHGSHMRHAAYKIVASSFAERNLAQQSRGRAAQSTPVMRPGAGQKKRGSRGKLPFSNSQLSEALSHRVKKKTGRDPTGGSGGGDGGTLGRRPVSFTANALKSVQLRPRGQQEKKEQEKQQRQSQKVKKLSYS